jgi:hypothetical protein
LLDKAALPWGLVADAVWLPRTDSDARPAIAHVVDRGRPLVGATLIAVGSALGLASMLLGSPFWVTFAPFLAAWAGAAYGASGRTGFYEVADSGRLGRYLGRKAPDLGSMREGQRFG